jgi:lambda family phage portal protein
VTAPLILDHRGAPVSSVRAESTYFEGASIETRFGEWGLSGVGPNAAVGTSAPTLRKRARTLCANNPLAKGGLDSFVSNLVGTDISPTWELKNSEQKEELQQLWADSQLEMDYSGFSDFYGLEELACRAVVQDGEVLGRFHDAHPAEGLIVPLQIQLLEADHLDSAYNDISPAGNEIRFGMEWKNGRRIRYWLNSDHPGETFFTQGEIRKIPVDAKDMLHVFRPLRPGQARGVSWLAPIIVKLREIDIYDDAEVVRKKASALWGGFIYSDNPLTDRAMGGRAEKTVNGAQSIRLEAGTFPVLKNGQKIDFHTSADVGNNYMDFMRTQFRLIARGWGITYEQLTGDLSGVNYTSLRAGLIEFRRLCKQIQRRTLIHQFCRPVINRWIYTAMLTGAVESISLSEYLQSPRIFHRVDWNPDGWDFTDPVKDRLAILLDIRNGLSSRMRAVASRGGRVEQIDQENLEDLERTIAQNLVYDCYPSQTNQAGALQDKLQEQAILDSIKEES